MNQPVSSDAVRFFHEAVAAEQQGDNSTAYQLLIASIADDPNLPGAWHNLGSVLGKMKHFPAACAALHKSMQMAPQASMPISNYAWMKHLSGHSEQALPFILRVLQQEPDKPQHWTNLSQIQLSLDKYAEALEAGLKAATLAPDDSMARLALALAQLRIGDYANGLREYEARFPYVLPAVLKYPYPVWRGEDISEKRLFVPAEQGIGDSVMFMRFLPAAIKKAKKTIIYVHDNTASLYRRNLTGNIEIHPLPRELPAADVFCPLLSLPVALGLTNEAIKNSFYKYKYSPFHKHAKDFPAKTFKIGICWAGDPKHDNDKYRSSSLEHFLPLAELPDTQLYSFQIGPRRVDLDNFAAHGVVKNLEPQIRDTNETCAILAEHMDAVVTVDTAFAHLAGSTGAETYVMLGKNGVDWRWLAGEGATPWYPSMTLVRQERIGDWDGCVDRIKKMILEKYNTTDLRGQKLS